MSRHVAWLRIRPRKPTTTLKKSLFLKQNPNQNNWNQTNTEFISLFSQHGKHHVRSRSTPITNTWRCNKTSGITRPSPAHWTLKRHTRALKEKVFCFICLSTASSSVTHSAETPNGHLDAVKCYSLHSGQASRSYSEGAAPVRWKPADWGQWGMWLTAVPFPPLTYALLFPGQATWLCGGLRVSSPTALCSTPLCGLNRTHTVTHTPFNAPEWGEQTYAAQHTVSCCGVVMLTKYQPKFSAACITTDPTLSPEGQDLVWSFCTVLTLGWPPYLLPAGSDPSGTSDLQDWVQKCIFEAHPWPYSLFYLWVAACVCTHICVFGEEVLAILPGVVLNSWVQRTPLP